jgi:hypothetical protein
MAFPVSKILLFFGIFWSGMVLVFDTVTLLPVIRQLKATKYASTQGTILSSEVTSHDDSDSTTYGVALKYSYSVEDREYVGTKYRYDTSSSSDHWAFRVVDAMPPGKKVAVFYNPQNPSDAVLSTGLLGSDFFMAMFLTPFNMVMLGFCWAGWRKFLDTRRKPVAGGVRISSPLRQTRVRLTEFPIPAVALAMLAVITFLAIFVICPFLGGFHPSMHTMMVAWTVILVATLGSTAWHALRVLTGRYDLILDELGGFLELPATEGRKTRRRLPFRIITCIRIETVVTPKDSEGSTRRYAVILELADGELKTERLVQWSDRAKIEGFVEWLHAKLPMGSPPEQAKA